MSDDTIRTELHWHARVRGTRAVGPSSARRTSTSADEDIDPPIPVEDDISSIEDDWPGQFGAARLGIP